MTRYRATRAFALLHGLQFITPLQETAVGQKRLLKVTAGNLRQNHLYIRGHFDFFPRDAIGSPKRNGNGHHGIELILDGLTARHPV